MAEGVQLVTIEERLEGWRNRYGETKWLEENGRILYSIKQELEDLLGRSLNSLLFHPTHLDDSGAAKMVDIGWKSKTERIARATGFIKMKSATLRIALEKSGKKGDVFQVARVAAILAAKKTFEIIPLCHQIPLSSIQVDFLAESKGIRINSFVKTTYSTGVEMEAITAVSVAALTIYDMLKGIDKTMEIGEIHLEEKQGGKSGAFFWPGFSAR
ncbi:MAG: cyclic pyranopterin monophosphate synthase MoaC [Planctomycetota bacterium]|nr:MAG: cyclic pyranopterin monophosphate synthase MoaC [Planctomycetota bacterium]